jgi:hypothetical protein
MRRKQHLTAIVIAGLAVTLSSCALLPPQVISEEKLPVSVEATQITPTSLDWEGYFVPDCPQIKGYAAELRQKTKLVEGVTYTAPSLTAWRLIHIVFEAESTRDAEDCIGVPSAEVRSIPVSTSFDTDLQGTAFSQITDLSVLGTIEGVKTMVSSGKYLIYIDTFAHEATGFDLAKLYHLTNTALN